MRVIDIVYETESVGGTYTIETIQYSTILGGTFQLIMPVVHHEGHGKYCESIRVGVEDCDDPILQPALEKTRDLPWNISASEMEYEIQRNIWYVHHRLKIDSPTSYDNYLQNLTNMISVTRSVPDLQRGFTWSVTFKATPTLYDPPNMLIDVTKMSGYKPKGVVKTVSNGKAPLAGNYYY